MKKIKIVAECEAGVCPICSGALVYNGSNKTEGFHYWTCPDCGATGKEGFDYIEGHGEDDDFDAWDDTEFDGHHYDVRLKDGTQVEIIGPNHPDAIPVAPKVIKPVAMESGICPICGGKLEYGEPDDQDGGCVIAWTCSDCGATGEEGREEIFNGEHYDVKDANGVPVEFLRPAGSVMHEEGICPFCGAEYQTTSVDDTYSEETHYWVCKECGTTGKALYHSERTFDGFEDVEHDGIFLAVEEQYAANTAECNQPCNEVNAPTAPMQPIPENPHITFEQILDLIDAHRCHDFIKTNDDAEILIKGSRTKVDAIADFLDCLGFDVVTGFYDPKEDAACGICDGNTGYRYIRINGQ